MRAQDIALLFVLGLAMWILGTVYYASTGPALLETTNRRYWASFIISPILSAVVCIAILRWRGISNADWASAMLLLAIPGMIGEAVVLTNLRTFMPKLHATSGGKYAASLFATYAIARRRRSGYVERALTIPARLICATGKAFGLSPGRT